jgi:hypothetical protein
MSNSRVKKFYEKGPKPVLKSKKMGGKWKKGYIFLTLERNLDTKNDHFLSNVVAALVFFRKTTILTLRFRQLNTDKLKKCKKMLISNYFL